MHATDFVMTHLISLAHILTNKIMIPAKHAKDHSYQFFINYIMFVK